MTFIQRIWVEYRLLLIGAAIVLTLIAACWRLANEIPLLAFQSGGSGAYDLGVYYESTRRWFSGESVYFGEPQVKYPPGSYVIFWPFMGWLSFGSVRWLWALVCVGSITGISWMAWTQTPNAGKAERALMGLVPFGAYASAATIRVGQVSLLVLLLLVATVSLLERSRKPTGSAILAGLLLVVALTKPILTLPFVLVVFLLPRLWIASLTCFAGYLLITYVASLFQPAPAPALFLDWLQESAAWGNFDRGHANLYRVLTLAGLEAWLIPATVLTAALFALWIVIHRNASFWHLAGVATLVTRLTFYHRLYDDVLIYPTMIALLRLATQPEAGPRVRVLAGVLFFLNWGGMLAPGSLLNEPGPLRPVAEVMQGSLWLATLAFMLRTIPNSDSPGLENRVSPSP